jgi:erythromycin esterase-like protein
LDKVDPEGAKRARYRYSCFDQFGEDTQAYGYAAMFGLTESCEREAVGQLVELRRHATMRAATGAWRLMSSFLPNKTNAW